MWLKILKYTVIIGQALGFDKRLKDWVNNRLNGIEKRVKDVDEVMSRDIPAEEDDA